MALAKRDRAVRAVRAAQRELQADDIPLQADDIPLQADDIPLQADGIQLQADGIPLQTDDIPLQADGIPLQAAGLHEARLQGGIGGAPPPHHQQPATATVLAGRAATRARPAYHEAQQGRPPAYHPAASAAAISATAAPAAPDAPAAAAAADSKYVTPRAAAAPGWHAQWCAPEWSGEGVEGDPRLGGNYGTGRVGPRLGEHRGDMHREQQQHTIQHWSPQVRGS